MMFKDTSLLFSCDWSVHPSVSLKQISSYKKSISACTNLLWKRKKIRVSREWLIIKVFFDYKSTTDEINLVWKFPYTRLALWPTQTEQALIAMWLQICSEKGFLSQISEIVQNN